MNKPKRTKKAAPQQGTRRVTLRPDEFPEIYGMETVGKCLEPEIMEGTHLLFSRDEKYWPGDLILLHFRPEILGPGDHQFMVKKLVFGVPHAYWRNPSCNAASNIKPTVVVEMLNPRKMIYINPAALLGIHKCLGPVADNQQTYIATDEDIRAIAGRVA